mmetsp:Transcript_3734/g.8658  ORF Transcript_3734/g.8658 Transcript_3734/m.8658 type:complete len:267 (+) Transcript_3734:356-1156(+)
MIGLSSNIVHDFVVAGLLRLLLLSELLLGHKRGDSNGLPPSNGLLDPELCSCARVLLGLEHLEGILELFLERVLLCLPLHWLFHILLDGLHVGILLDGLRLPGFDLSGGQANICGDAGEGIAEHAVDSLDDGLSNGRGDRHIERWIGHARDNAAVPLGILLNDLGDGLHGRRGAPVGGFLLLPGGGVLNKRHGAGLRFSVLGVRDAGDGHLHLGVCAWPIDVLPRRLVRPAGEDAHHPSGTPGTLDTRLVVGHGSGLGETFPGIYL